MGNAGDQRWQTISLAIFSILLVSVASLQAPQSGFPANHRNDSDPSTLKMEPRDSEAVSLDEGKPDKASSTTDRISTTTSKVKNISTTEVPRILVSQEPKRDIQKDRRPYLPINTDHRAWKSVKVGTKKDSYLEALEHSHTSKDPKEGMVQVDGKSIRPKSIRREYVQGPVYHGDVEYGAPKKPETVYGAPNGPSGNVKSPRIIYGGLSPSQDSYSFNPSDTYSLPVQSSVDFKDRESYAPPSPVYGAPHGSYGPPSKTYGAPSYQQQSYGTHGNSYLPPQQAYGPPHETGYGAPYAIHQEPHLPIPSIDFSWPFALKLNAFTLAKILLKLIIFKMIVKFIAVICLLLFIPKLEFIKKKIINKGGSGGGSHDDDDDDDDDDDESRSFSHGDFMRRRLNLLTSLVLEAVEKYEVKNDDERSVESTPECDSIVCRIRRTLFASDTWNDYLRLFKSYVIEERQIAQQKTS